MLAFKCKQARYKVLIGLAFSESNHPNLNGVLWLSIHYGKVYQRGFRLPSVEVGRDLGKELEFLYAGAGNGGLDDGLALVLGEGLEDLHL